MNQKNIGSILIAGAIALMPLRTSVAMPGVGEGPSAPGVEGQLQNQSLSGALMDFVMFLVPIYGEGGELDGEEFKVIIGKARNVDVLARKANAGEVLPERSVRKALMSVLEITGVLVDANEEIADAVNEAAEEGRIKKEQSEQIKKFGFDKKESILAAANEAKAVLLAAKTK